MNQPLRLHPENPHYFEFRGRPAVLVTSGEHYGAVLNGDFDYRPYLDELARQGFNQTRTFAGTYREMAGSFKIEHNTLAPRPEGYLAPWPRSDAPGAADGLNKFDLSQWNEAYFSRLKDFVGQAGRRGIVVELVLFCPFYGPELWDICPMNARNNVNGIGQVDRDEPLTLRHADLVAVQDRLVRRIVSELNACDNVYYEICNEPYIKTLHPKTGYAADDWQAHVAAVIAETEADRPRRHLIAQNIDNGSVQVERPDANVSILNFHYSNPPDSVALNWGLGRAIGFDETGFRGRDDLPYRCDGWDFLVAGGAVYSHLDYSYTAEHPGGTFAFVSSPSGGGPVLRRQLAILKRFIESFDFLRMRPDNTFILGGIPEGATARALADPGRAYAVHVRGGRQARLGLRLPAGTYLAEWVNPLTGNVDQSERLEHGGGSAYLAWPEYAGNTALRILAGK